MKQHEITYQTVSRETFRSTDEIIEAFRAPLETYLNQLFWWNERINLVSRDVSRGTVWEHIRHSLLITQIPTYQDNPIIVDAGTGGGLPGLPLSIVEGDKQFILNDIVTKKILAVKQIARKLSLENLSTADGSIAALSTDNPFLLVSKHAFKINDLFHLANDLPWTGMIFYKGIHFKDELKGINVPLSITVYDLYDESQQPFYKDKALIVVSVK